MTDQQSGKSKQAVAWKIVLLGAIATALGVINMMMNGSEAPSSSVAILQYAALALGLFALVGGLIMMVLAPSDSRP
jgi:NADH:ubiquinone oxidoreductase subunit 6 (subunit J)